MNPNPQTGFHAMKPHAKKAMLIAVIGLIALVFPAALTLRSVRSPGSLQILEPNPTPYGYTISLLLFLIPDLILVWWIVRHPNAPIARQAFYATIGSIFVTGCILDFGFARAFFTYGNPEATLGIRLPAFSLNEGWVSHYLPIEEFAFYYLGGLFMAGLYVWSDLAWLGRATAADPATVAGALVKERRSILRVHPTSIAIGAILIGAAIVACRLLSDQPGFPGYFVFLVLSAFIPTAITYPVVKDSLNWQAFTVMFLSLQLISLLWEATLAVPYNWWNYRHEQMLGIFIGAWAHLPIEAVLVWITAGWSTVIMYEWYRILFHRRQMAKLSDGQP
jgi:hypothetical protein